MEQQDTTVAMSYNRRYLLVVVLLLIACVGSADELGASLQLEGRMACQRGVARLITWQSADGSWQQDSALTAHAALALAQAAGNQPDADAARSRARVFVQEMLARETAAMSPAAKGSEPLTAGAMAMALRLFLREGAVVPPELVSRLKSLVAAGKTSADDAMVVLETLLLQQPGAAMAQPGAQMGGETTRLAEMLLARIKGGGTVGSDASLPGVEAWGELQAARMALGEVSSGAAARRRLEALLGEANGASEVRFAELYWLARVLYAQVEAGSGDVAGWRRPLLIALLEMQRGDGGWGRGGDSSAARIVDSAWALQTLTVLLAAAPQGEK